MRKGIFILAAVTAIGLTGCVSVPTLSEEQNDAIAEYMADSLLKSDKNYSSTVKLNSVTESTEPEPTIQPIEEPKASATPKASEKPAVSDNDTDSSKSTETPDQTYVSLSDAMQVPGFSIKFKSYKCDTNISTNDSNISAKSGKKLLVIKMKFKNTTDSSKKLDMTQNHSSYSLSIDGKQIEAPLLTISGEDIHFIKKSVAAKKSVDAILVFEIPSKSKIKDAQLEVTNNNSVAKLNIK